MNDAFSYTVDTECGPECDVCLGEHDEAIHDATINVHTWFRGHVTKYLDAGQVEKKRVA